MTAGQLRTHEIVLRHIEDELESGRLRVGGRLPGERALALSLGVSRPSVREAIRVLEAMGILHTSAGSGPDSGAIVVADAATGITSALRLHLATTHFAVADLVQTRLMVESWSVRQAARRRAGTDFAAAHELIRAMDDTSLSQEEFHLLDAQFHVALAQAAGNEVVAAIMASLRGAIHDYVVASAATVPDWPLIARRLRRQHRAVLASIEAGDGERAAGQIVRHIEGFYRDAVIPRT